MRSERHECRPDASRRPAAAVTLTEGSDGWSAGVEWMLPSGGAGYTLRPAPTRDHALRRALGAIRRDLRSHLALCGRLGGVSAREQRTADAIAEWSAALLTPDLFAGVA